MKRVCHTATVLLAPLALAFLVSSIAGQQTEPRDRQDDREAGGRDRRPEGGGPLMRLLDANGDGELSSEEIKSASQGLATLDGNGDGRLTRDEMRPPRRDGRTSPDSRVGDDAREGRRRDEEHGGREESTRPGGVDPLQRALDRDGDGELSAEEVQAAPASLQALDTNGNGRVTREELRRREEEPPRRRSGDERERDGSDSGRTAGPRRDSGEEPYPVQLRASPAAIPGLMRIPAGAFEMGDHHNFVDPKHGGDETPIHTVRLDAFLMAKTHVTNRQYGEFLNAASTQNLVEVRNGLVYGSKQGSLYCDTHESDSACSIGWDGKVFAVVSRPDHPMVCVRWEGAAAYCNWLSEQSGLQPCYDPATWKCDFTKNGFRLPTEAEWEYAARGGQVDPYRVYPYGDEPDDMKANMPGSGDPFDTGPLPHTTPVGFYNGDLRRKADFGWHGQQETYQTADGANGFGLYDMAGNAWQWCNDWYDSGYYSVSPVDNPKGPERGKVMPDGKTYRCIRGGSWYNGPDGHSRVANRNPAYYRGPKDPDHNWYAIGFRIARNAELVSETTASAASVTGNAEPTVGLLLNTPRAFAGYTLFAPKHFLLTYLMDNEGRVINSWQSKYEPGQSAYLLPNGHLLRACFTRAYGFTGGGEGGRIEEYDWEGKMVWEFDYAGDAYMQHHDIKPLPNGNILMLVVEKKTREQCLAAGFDERTLQDRELYPDSVVEIQPTYPKGGKVVWEWHVWDHLVQDTDQAKPNFGRPADHPELIWVNCNGRPTRAFWNHMNSLDYSPKLDQIMLSVRGCSEIWIIDHSTTTDEAAGHTGGRCGKGGDLLYRWGNPAAYGRGTTQDQMLFQQHDAQWIADDLPGAGHILVFNNGLNRVPPGVMSRRDLPSNPVGKDWGYSSVDEIVPPVNIDGIYDLRAGSAYGPDKLHWTYIAKNPTDFFAEAISGAQRLPGGNTLICDGTSGVFLEVTPAGETVWKYVNPVVRTGPLSQGQSPGLDHRGHKWNAVFKITRYASDYPGLAGKGLTPREVIPGSGPQMPERARAAEPPRRGPQRDGDRPPRDRRGEGRRELDDRRPRPDNP